MKPLLSRNDAKQRASPAYPQLALGHFALTEDLHLHGNGFQNSQNPPWIYLAKIDTNVAFSNCQTAYFQLSESRET